MTIDLWILAATALFTWILIMADATPSILGKGVSWASGNREEAPDPVGMHGRLHRCNLNMQENFPIFAAVVLIVHVSGQANGTSALGTEVFLAARLAHAATYLAGISYLRTALWGVSIAGMAMVASAMF
ncbi:MAG: MAPEG family protein [Proteobacteria bacterium]|nr:MAPEG family protein [Pseudomonadota bacterium]